MHHCDIILLSNMLYQLAFVVTLLLHGASLAPGASTTSKETENVTCGTIDPEKESRLVGGPESQRGLVPWYASVYKKTTAPYMLICGGSLVLKNVVITSASCFWSIDGKPARASDFAVAVGKLHRSWNHPSDDDDAQKADVKDIHIPNRYQGSAANFQDDVAVVVLATPFEYNANVRPVCLSFDPELDRQQLRSGNQGKIASWGELGPGKKDPVLTAMTIPYMELTTCISKAPPHFAEYITSDKFCVGPMTPEAALCRGDGGAGLSFAHRGGALRYYLRGVVSVSPSVEAFCNTDSVLGLTHLIKHESFIKQYLTDA